MAKAPRWQPALDQEQGTESIADPAEASIAYIQTIEGKQHALMSGWGGQGHCYGCHIVEGETKTLHVRVPSGTSIAHLGIVVSGTGSATITSDTDATGTTLQWAVGGAADTMDTVAVVWTSGSNAGAAAATGRDINVSSAASWRWENEAITIASSSGSGEDGVIWGLVVYGVFLAV